MLPVRRAVRATTGDPPGCAGVSEPPETRKSPCVTTSIPEDLRELLKAPNYVHLATLRADGSPRDWVVWVRVEGDHILVCTSDATWKAKDMRRDPRVALPVSDMANPY